MCSNQQAPSKKQNKLIMRLMDYSGAYPLQLLVQISIATYCRNEFLEYECRVG